VGKVSTKPRKRRSLSSKTRPPDYQDNNLGGKGKIYIHFFRGICRRERRSGVFFEMKSSMPPAFGGGGEKQRQRDILEENFFGVTRPAAVRLSRRTERRGMGQRKFHLGFFRRRTRCATGISTIRRWRRLLGSSFEEDSKGARNILEKTLESTNSRTLYETFEERWGSVLQKTFVFNYPKKDGGSEEVASSKGPLKGTPHYPGSKRKNTLPTKVPFPL